MMFGGISLPHPYLGPIREREGNAMSLEHLSLSSGENSFLSVYALHHLAPLHIKSQWHKNILSTYGRGLSAS